MKILQLIYSLSSGGGERFVVDLCNRLSQNTNNEIVLVSILDSNNPKMVYYLPDLSKNVQYINLHQTHGLSFSSILAVFDVIRKEKPDIVHCHSNLMLLYLPALLNKRVKYVHTLHNLASYCAGTRINQKINGYLYRKNISPITISKTCEKSFSEMYGDGLSSCITNGREPMISAGKIPSDIHLHSGYPVFIHVARCAPQKNQNRLFRVFDRLFMSGIEFELICIGSHYENYIRKYQNHPLIHIIGERRNVSDYISIADYFILSSDFEGLPLTLLEAMSLGVVPVCTPAGGIVDVIEDGINGYMTQGFEDEELYQLVIKAINEKGKISPASIKKIFDANYSMKVCADKYYNLFINL